MSKLIPFSCTPASWGLRGPAREEAEAAYYLSGYELDKRLAEIRWRDTNNLPYALLRVELNHSKLTQLDYDLNVAALDLRGSEPDVLTKAALGVRLRHGVISSFEHDLEILNLDFPKNTLEKKKAKLAVELAHDKISAYDFDIGIAELDTPDADSVERALAILEVDHKHGKVDDHNFKKDRATLNEEPWIGIVDQGFDPGKGLNGVYFEFDWNEHWIVYLRMNGYMGMSDDQVVDQWFSDVCRSQGVAPMQATLDGTVIPFSGRNKDDA